jgi:hypothetical protein
MVGNHIRIIRAHVASAVIFLCSTLTLLSRAEDTYQPKQLCASYQKSFILFAIGLQLVLHCILYVD